MNRTFGSATLAAAAAISLVLTGCASGEKPTAPGSDAPVTITFANADPSETWAEAIKGFQDANPTIKVKQLNIPYAQYVSTINQRLNGKAADIDVLVVDAGGVLADWKNRGFLGDLSSLKDAADKAAVSPDMISAREVDGSLYALPTWTTSQFLYYNADVLKKAGVEAPTDDPSKPWTYEEVTAAAKKIKDAGAAEYPLLFDQWDSYYQLQMMGVSAGGGDGIDAEGKVDFSNAGWQKMLTWYHDLFESGISPRGITNDKNGALFQAGKAGFIISGPWGVSVANEGDINYGIAPAPYFADGKPATSTDSWAVALSAKSEKQDAAKKFIEYVTIDAEGNAKSAEVANITPTNKVANEAYAKAMSASGGEATSKFGDILTYQLQNNAVHRPNVVGYSVFEPGANQMFSDIRNGSDPAERAAQADTEIAAQIARLK